MTVFEIIFLVLFIITLVAHIVYRSIIIPELEVKKDIYDLASKRIKELSRENIKLKQIIKRLKNYMDLDYEDLTLKLKTNYKGSIDYIDIDADEYYLLKEVFKDD